MTSDLRASKQDLYLWLGIVPIGSEQHHSLLGVIWQALRRHQAYLILFLRKQSRSVPLSQSREWGMQSLWTPHITPPSYPGLDHISRTAGTKKWSFLDQSWDAFVSEDDITRWFSSRHANVECRSKPDADIAVLNEVLRQKKDVSLSLLPHPYKWQSGLSWRRSCIGASVLIVIGQMKVMEQRCKWPWDLIQVQPNTCGFNTTFRAEDGGRSRHSMRQCVVRW